MTQINATSDAVSYPGQLQAALFCPAPVCISFGVDDAIRYKGNSDGTVENAADPGYISNALL